MEINSFETFFARYWIMAYFLLSILASTLIFLVFKLFQRFGIQTFQAIVFNYWTAFLFGFSLIESKEGIDVSALDWLWLVPIEGVLFISIFNVMALTVQKHSVTVGSVASRTAMIIPAAVFMIADPSEGFSLWKVMGIILACSAVYLSSKKSEGIEIDPKYIYLPLILFLGSGMIDLIIGYAQSYLMKSEEEGLLFIPGIFLIAAILGSTFLIYKYRVEKSIKWQSKDVIGGIILGLVNYASLFFILKAMDTRLLPASLFFPVNNMGIIVAGTLLGLLAFRERLSVTNWFGIFLGMIAISMMILAA
ncbi:MAG: EamA/RhaT family transporter [Flavobacteriales bacterium]|nr:EamA/RhaT family transporter [Flavobacteriales bacterium]